MSILDNLRSFEFDRNKKRIFGIKSAIVWGHSKDCNGYSPLLYISKPKHVSQEDFDFILDHLDLTLYTEKKVR
jgi:hypothetical protein